MTKEVSCNQLGIKDCDFVAKGDAAGDVVKTMVEHIRSEHDIEMPDTDVILEGEVIEDPTEAVKPDRTLIVKRLKETLNIAPPKGPDMPKPSIGRTQTR
jgi:predicted small metal-binding protein